MNCEQCRKMLVEFVEGSGEEMATVAAHLAACVDCQKEQREIEGIRRRLVELSARESGMDLSGAVMERIAEREKPAWRITPRKMASLIVAAAIVIIAVAVMVFVMEKLLAPAVTLADVKSALDGRRWVHVRNDGGQIQEHWFDLELGRSYAKFFDGDAVYIDEQANKRLWYWHNTNVIDEDVPTIYQDGKIPAWKQKSAWELIVEPLEQRARQDGDVKPHQDSIDGKAVIRFDLYGKDGLDRPMLYSQLWVDKQTRLPVRVKTRLQLGEREREKDAKEWSMREYDFPAKGPASIYDLGVSKEVAIEKADKTPAPEVKKIMDAIRKAHDDFPANYRSVVWREGTSEIDINWRMGEKRWSGRYFNLEPSGVPGKTAKYYVAPPLTAEKILDWAATQRPINVGMLDGQREYNRYNEMPWSNAQARVHVIRHGGLYDLLSKEGRPEEIAWPTWFTGGPIELIKDSPEMPVGTIGLRYGGAGDRRHDYYVDPSLKYACVKEIDWEKRGGQWQKEREYWTTYQRTRSSPIPTTRMYTNYGDPTKGYSRDSFVEKIDVKVMKESEIPQELFDGKKLMEGAKVEGY